ncbi:MAG: phosphoribosylformylglycinamidine synthase subunit PurS [Gemmatimonadaceae bacterium]|nr:phosphoribosylformylglycinamidine synthase subunit PurS [Gemmatimonadaceae bacterium]
MSRFRVSVHIVPRKGLLDPQGKAVSDALHALGFADVEDTRIGRYIVLDVKAESAAAAELSVKAMCDKLLANPVTEDYRIASTVTA